jgi:glycerophosphoryl diester phosphodiesterase
MITDLEACRDLLAMEGVRELRKKLVAHRGWHAFDAETSGRPLENTRQAYLDAASLGVPYSECDVWITRDNYVVLCHDWNFQSMAEDENDPLATTAIVDLSWGELSKLRVKGGVSPVLLSTVLEDLKGTGMLLAIELKSSGPAAHLADLLSTRSDLKESVACVLSFSLLAIERFQESMQTRDVRIAWVVDNPSTPYRDEDKNEGETTFDYANETLAMCLARLEMTDRIRELQCGLFVQYNPCLTKSHILAWRAELASIRLDCAAAESEVFIGIWNDVSLDPGFDRAVTFLSWLSAVSTFHTDMPPAFWSGFDFASAQPGSGAKTSEAS